MSLKSSTSKLNRAVVTFRHTWQQVRTDWRDGQALAFEKDYVMLLDSCVKRAVTGMDHMDGILAKARRDCG